MEQDIGTLKLFINTLEKMGCSYRIVEDKEDDKVEGEYNVIFTWEDEDFLTRIDDKMPFVIVWQIEWAEYSLDDMDAFSKFRKVINEANKYNKMVTVFYAIEEESGTFTLNSKAGILFTPSIEHLEDYLDAVLTSFDKAQDYVKDEMIKCFMEEELQVKIDS